MAEKKFFLLHESPFRQMGQRTNFLRIFPRTAQAKVFRLFVSSDSEVIKKFFATKNPLNLIGGFFLFSETVNGMNHCATQ